MKLKNNYFVLRHGYSLANLEETVSCWPEKKEYPLTEKGIKQVLQTVNKIKKKKIDLIFYSDLLRTKQTALIVAQALKIKPKKNKRLREINVGTFNGKKVTQTGRFWDKKGKLPPLEYYQKRFYLAPEKGETYFQIEKRMISFIKEQEKKYNKKNILIVSHQRPITLLEKKVKNYSFEKMVKIIVEKKEIKTGEFRKLN